MTGNLQQGRWLAGQFDSHGECDLWCKGVKGYFNDWDRTVKSMQSRQESMKALDQGMAG